MKPALSTSLAALTLEEKVDSLRSFIVAEFAKPSGQWPQVTVIARAPVSPVAKTIAELAPEFVTRGVAVRMIFGTTEGLSSTDPWHSERSNAALNIAVRFARKPRLIEAHEQLVAGPAASWVGDTMRRDPMKRDAYEMFSRDNRSAALLAASSFERLWRVCEAAMPIASSSALFAVATTDITPPGRTTADHD